MRRASSLQRFSFCAASLAQATPREALVRLIPDDVAVCVLFNKLHSQTAKLHESPWFKKIQQTPLGKMLGNGREWNKLNELGEKIAKRLDLRWDKVRGDVFGDTMLLAYRPGSPDMEAGLILVQARDAALLEKLIDRYHAELRKTGELKSLDSKQYQGLAYLRRVDKAGEQYLFVKDGVLALSPREDMIRQVLDRVAQPKTPALPVLEQAGRVGSADALAVVWLNPRAFDSELQQNLAILPPDQRRGLQAFMDHWAAVEGVCLALTVDPEPELAVSLHAKTSALPATAQRLARDLAVPSDLWQRFPPDSVLAVAARCDFAALNQTLEAFLSADQRQRLFDSVQQPMGLSLGKDVLRNSITGLGPDWGVSVTAVEDPKKYPHVLIALRVRPGAAGQQVQQEKSVMAAMQLFVGLAVADHNFKNKDKIRMRHDKDGIVLVNDKRFPAGFSPAFAIKEGYLVVGSSPEALRSFRLKGAPVASLEAPIARLSMTELSKMLAVRREPIVHFLAQQKQLTPAEAAGVFDRLLGDLSLFDRLEVNQRTDNDRVAWIVRLKTGKQ